MHRYVAAVVTVVCLVGGHGIAEGQQPAGSRSTIAAPDLDITHFMLVSEFSTQRARPRDAAEWERLAKEKGFRQQERGGPWSLKTEEGELRVTTFFNADGTSYWIILFPSTRDSVPDSILAHFLNDARYTSLDGDQLEIGVAPIERLDGGGSKARNITVSITGGRLLASRTMIEWK